MDTVSEVMNTSLDLSGLHLGKISLQSLLSALLTLVICLIAVRLVVTLLRRVLSRTSMDSRVQKYLLTGVRTALWVVTILIAADQLGIPVTSLVALLSVLSLAISLAVQTLLSNVAGGLVILTTKLFKPGDYIETADGTGTVREIRLSYTSLDTLDGLRISIPNSALSSGKVINYNTLGRRRVEHRISASYDAATDDVRRACLAAVERTPRVLPAPVPTVYVEEYGESSNTYTVRCWCRTGDYWDVYYTLLEQIRTAFDEVGVEMTYNHLNVHILDK
jgi:small conductance mechanosensitive channel